MNFASGHQDEESPGEEFDTDSEREEAAGDDSAAFWIYLQPQSFNASL